MSRNLHQILDHLHALRPADALDELLERLISAAHEAEFGGADCITLHLREDRRHIHDADLERVAALVNVKLNLEMAATAEMLEIATRVRPHMVTLVPEGRREVTTESGLGVLSDAEQLREAVKRLDGASIICSAFINADEKHVEKAREIGFSVCEIHTGPYANAFQEAGGDFFNECLAGEFEAVRAAGKRVLELGMRFNAGHGLNYHNVQPVAALPGVDELHIGHSIVSRAVYVGLREAVTEMKRLIDTARPVAT